MDDATVHRVLESEALKFLVRRRRRLGLGLVGLLVSAYVLFALLSTHAPDLLGARFARDAVFSAGVYYALGLCILAVGAAGWYTHCANSALDALEQQVAADLHRPE
jgi:uncharacterized membrane protein (DUF485 family)